MNQSELTDEHIDHLQNIGFGGLMRKVVPSHIEEHLLRLGYAKKAVGGTMITKVGYKALIDWDSNGN